MMGAVAGGGGYTQAERAFAKALSLHRPGVPVPFKDVQRLAREVLRGDRPMAMDAGRVLEDALKALEDHLSNVLDGDDLHHALELANSVANAAQRDEDLRKADAVDGRRARDAEAEQRGAADRRRLAADARPSVLDGVLAGVRKPMRV